MGDDFEFDEREDSHIAGCRSVALLGAMWALERRDYCRRPMSYKVPIRNNATGETRVRVVDMAWTDGTFFWWTGGNFGCDCNRAMEFARAAGECGNDVDVPCGATAFYVPYADLPDGTRALIDDDPLAER